MLATPFPASSLDAWVRNILVRSCSLPEDIRVHPKRVSSAIGSPGFPILGVVSVLILAYSLVPRIQWTGNSLFNSTSSISTPLRWSYFAKMSLYQGLVRVSNTPRSPLLSLCLVKISREVFNHHVWISISLSVVCMSVSILLNSFRTGCLPIRPSKAADAYEFPAPVSSSARHRIPQTSTTTTG